MSRGGLRHYLVAGGVLTGAAAVGGAAFILSGLYNVSAARDHVDLTTWLLDVVRQRSVSTQSAGVTVPPLDGDGMIALGALHYDAGCAPCHGAPGVAPAAFAPEMLPSPPALNDAAREWSAAELFWIIRNGQKYTGMPAWIAHEREDEVWPVVAFVRHLPSLDAGSYRELLGPERPVESGGELPEVATGDDLIAQCVTCHGDGTAPVNSRVPMLAGQHPEYLRRALTEYALGRRESGTMQLFAKSLTEAEIAQVADYFSTRPAIRIDGPVGGDSDNGATIFSRGLPDDGVPSCVSCHVLERTGQFPRLAGLSATYVAQQLKNWKSGLRDETGYGMIMATIARRLSDQQAEDVAAYIQSLPPPSGEAQ